MSTYVFSDIHGNYKIFQNILKKIKPSDTIYFLGDAIDRGPDGWKILKELLNNPQVEYIKGNHEQMFIDYFEDGSKNVWFYNGGKTTYEECIYDDDLDIILPKIQKLPYKKTIEVEDKTILLSHAGCKINDFNTVSEYDSIWDRYHMVFEEDLTNCENTFLIHGHTPLISAPIWYNGNDIGEHYPDKTHHRCDIDAGTYNTNKTILMKLEDFSYEIITE